MTLAPIVLAVALLLGNKDVSEVVSSSAAVLPRELAELKVAFPPITNVVLRLVSEGDGGGRDVLAQWAASRESGEPHDGTNVYAQVDFVLHPEPGSDIRCRLLLPPRELWDGRLWGHGNSGWAGSMPRGLWRFPASNTAVVTTELGTWRITDEGRTNEHAWPESVRRDYDWRATHLMTEWGVKICTAFYGKAPHHRYFAGGSCGGRQAMSEAIRFPADYDGILCHLPANCGVVKEAAMFHLFKATHDNAGCCLFTTNEMRVVANAACAYKGVRVLDDPRFSEAEIDGFLDLAARQAPHLAQGDLLARLKSLYMPVYLDGACLFNGFAPGAYQGKNMGWKNFLRFGNYVKWRGWCTDAAYTNATWRQFAEFARDEGAAFNACSPDLSAFRLRGGKLLMTAGLEDQTIPPFMIMDYYESVCAADGGIEKTKDYFRLWCIPGCAHGGGKGRLMTGPPNGPEYRALLAAWLEEGKIPEDVYPGWEYPGSEKGRGGFARIDPSFLRTEVKPQEAR